MLVLPLLPFTLVPDPSARAIVPEALILDVPALLGALNVTVSTLLLPVKLPPSLAPENEIELPDLVGPLTPVHSELAETLTYVRFEKLTLAVTALYASLPDTLMFTLKVSPVFFLPGLLTLKLEVAANVFTDSIGKRKNTIKVALIIFLNILNFIYINLFYPHN
jgi:hypothetical protein